MCAMSSKNFEKVTYELDGSHSLSFELGRFECEGKRMIWSTKVHLCYDLKKHLEDDIV
jgi:hypothetical protein